MDTIICKNENEWHAARRQDVTASTAAALLGVLPWLSPLGLFLEKTGQFEPVEETPPMKRGRLLEPVAVALLKEQRPGWSIKHNSFDVGPVTYLRDPNSRLGATPDVLAVDDMGRSMVVQIKSVAEIVFRKDWIDPDTREVVPPIHVAIQAAIEAHLVGATRAVAAALVVGFGIDLHLVEIPVHAGLVGRIKGDVAEFWRRVAANEPYAPDYAVDGDLIRRIYAESNGLTVNLPNDNRWGDLLAERARLKEIESAGSAAEKSRKALDAEIIFKLGNADAGLLADGTLISAKTTRRGAYEVKPTSFRTVKVSGGPPPSAAKSPVASAIPDQF